MATDDMWAVGYYGGQNAYQTLVEHWNGNQWSIVPSPNVGTENNIFYAVHAISANDVWAVGDYNYNELTLVEHWNGSQWLVVPSPNPPGTLGAGLSAVDAASSNDVWAVGGYEDGSRHNDTLTEHWDGQQWSIVPSPNLDQGTNGLYGVTAISSNDVWAAGYYVGNYGATLIEHWDGQQWRVVPSPSPGNDNLLYAVAAESSTDVWAVGWWDACFACPEYTLTEHYTAQCPSLTPTPTPTPSPSPTSTSSPTPTLSPINPPTSTSSVIASATSATSTATQMITGSVTSTTVASSTASPTSASSATFTALSTSTAYATTTATETVVATAITTATSCSIQFTDVPPGSTFYTFIRCMACRGIISGYSSGCETGNPCFRPSNNVTRGQLSKIISTSAGFNDVPTGQTFEDVAPDSTFYLYVERMASRGIISGYTCGGAGEPCDSQHRPYFRPNANATRGQIAKIDVLTAVQALWWTLLNPPIGTFQDVLPGTPFYQHIETAVAHGVLNGYQCGQLPAGQCVPPDNKPFFLQGNNATRGQTSKIVANTFFANCQNSDSKLGPTQTPRHVWT